MKTQKFILLSVLIHFYLYSYSQGFLISTPKLQFDGTQLKIGYDIVDKDMTDEFYVWVEMEKLNGEKIKAGTLTGDVGEKIRAGSNKSITWVPGSDSVFLNEEILVEVMAEKYVRKFNKGSMVLRSTLFPGLGQAKIKGKPYWLAGVATYGALAGGFVMRSKGNKDYDTYLHDTNVSSRSQTLEKAQKEMNTSSALIITGAAIAVGNLIWIAAMPNDYQPLKNARLSVGRSPDCNATLVALQITF